MKRTFNQINDTVQTCKIKNIIRDVNQYINNLSVNLIYPYCDLKCKNKCDHPKKLEASNNVANMISLNNTLINKIDKNIKYYDDPNFIYYKFEIDCEIIDSIDIIIFTNRLKIFNENLIEYQKENKNNNTDINNQILLDYAFIYDEHYRVIKHKLFQIIYKYIKNNKTINIIKIK